MDKDGIKKIFLEYSKRHKLNGFKIIFKNLFNNLII